MSVAIWSPSHQAFWQGRQLPETARVYPRSVWGSSVATVLWARLLQVTVPARLAVMALEAVCGPLLVPSSVTLIAFGRWTRSPKPNTAGSRSREH
jgi:hypothetical protein